MTTEAVITGTLKVIFNVFTNYMVYFIKRARLTNYEDDNTLSFAHPNFQIVKSCLEAEAAKAITLT